MSDEEKEPGQDASEAPIDRAKERLSQARERFAQAADTIGGRVRAASDAARGTGAGIGRRGRAAGKKAVAVAATARERFGGQAMPLREHVDQAREQAAGWADDLSDYVRRHPGRAIAAAIATGFLVGFLTRRRGD